MKEKNSTEELNQLIITLQNKQSQELISLKEQFHIAYESLKPINVIKSVYHEVASSPEIKNNLLNNTIGLTTGYLSKKVLFGSSHNPVKKLIGTLLQFAIANVVSKHTDTIKSAGGNLINRFLKYRAEAKKEFHHNGSNHSI